MHHRDNKKFQLSNNSINSDKLPKYKGLVLFDVDGTLTSGKNNEMVVQYCIDQGWAVGICTAGALYHMNNLLSFSWMPKNLWYFMRSHGDITFNNVASGFLMGKLNQNAYQNIRSAIPLGIDVFGYRKGFALEKTANALGISNPTSMILCDDMKSFIQGVREYNPALGIVCAGFDCGGNLTVEELQRVMNKF